MADLLHIHLFTESLSEGEEEKENEGNDCVREYGENTIFLPVVSRIIVFCM